MQKTERETLPASPFLVEKEGEGVGAANGRATWPAGRHTLR